MRRLDLVPICWTGGSALVERLSAGLERELLVEVRRRQVWFDPELSFDSSRGQYRSTALLRMLLDDPLGNDGGWVLGLAGVDLFAPVLTYVFGEAQLGGRAAVVSGHRLRPEAYGLPADDDVLLERLLKESLHELGHVLGLIHCPAPDCVMHPSTYAEDIDSKPAEFCTPCLRHVRKRVGGAPRSGPAARRA